MEDGRAYERHKYVDTQTQCTLGTHLLTYIFFPSHFEQLRGIYLFDEKLLKWTAVNAI